MNCRLYYFRQLSTSRFWTFPHFLRHFFLKAPLRCHIRTTLLLFSNNFVKNTWCHQNDRLDNILVKQRTTNYTHPLIISLGGLSYYRVTKQGLHWTQKLLNVQTERSIFQYANWPRLQIKRTGVSSWSVQLVPSAGPSSWSIQLVRSSGLFSWSVQLVPPAGLTSRPIYTLHPLRCI